ncbi:MAG: site-2 protease family protein [Treponema sp.]|nr:site-2 protease family protein [Treponema sp.]
MRIVLGLLCLCFLIFFHELGHFILAKLFGVKVEAFSVGFGPVLLHNKKGETDYRLSLIPLGGYCKMKGENDFFHSLELGLDHIEAEEDSLYGVSSIKRILISFAGPFFNLIYAFFGFFLIAIIGYSYYSFSNQINLATDLYPEMHSAAKEAGIQSGDKIIKINNVEIKNFSDMILEISSRPDEVLTVSVERENQILDFEVKTDFDKENGIGKIGVTAIQDSLKKYESPRYSFFPALLEAGKECGKTIKLQIKGIFTLFKGASLKNSVSGPARIADMVGSVITDSFSENFRSGIVNLLNFTGMISICLFIMNLLPIPVLDGGMILISFIELISCKKIKPKTLSRIQYIGIAFIFIMFFIGLSGDINYFINIFKGAK